MRTTKAAANLAFIIILYFTVTSFFLFCLKSLFLNEDFTCILIFVITMFFASHIVVYENLGSTSQSNSSVQFLESVTNLSIVSIPEDGDQDAGSSCVKSLISWELEVDHKDQSHRSTSEVGVGMEDENDEDEDDWGYDYEGDSEDNGDSEEDDHEFNKKIEEFIAVKKRVWRQEIINERLLYS